MKIVVKVTEILTRSVVVEADDYLSAEDKVRKEYYNGNIQLNADNAVVEMELSDDTKNLSNVEIRISTGNRGIMEYSRGDIVNYRGKKAKIIKAKIIGVSRKNDNTRYKLRLYDKFNTIVYNVRATEISK